MGKLEEINKARTALGLEPRVVLIWFEDNGQPRKKPLYDYVRKERRYDKKRSGYKKAES